MRAFFHGVTIAAAAGLTVGLAFQPALADLTRSLADGPGGQEPSLLTDIADAPPPVTSAQPWVVGTDYLKPPPAYAVAPIADYGEDRSAPAAPEWTPPEHPHVDYLAQAAPYPSEGGDITAPAASEAPVDPAA
jgi:hypothetical protein